MRRGIGRPGRGIVGTMATTAVVVGTAKAVSGSMDAKAQQKQQAAAQSAAADQAAVDAQTQVQQQQAEMEQMQQQMAAMQAQQAQAAIPAPAPVEGAPAPDMMAQLTQLAQLKETGVLSDEEFQAAKTKILGG
jgi:hypothetical protein